MDMLGAVSVKEITRSKVCDEIKAILAEEPDAEIAIWVDFSDYLRQKIADPFIQDGYVVTHHNRDSYVLKKGTKAKIEFNNVINGKDITGVSGDHIFMSKHASKDTKSSAMIASELTGAKVYTVI